MAGYTPLKVVVHLFNFLLLCCGLALIIGGTTFQVYYNDYLSGLETHLYIAPILFIIIGVVIFLVALLSCFGACKLQPWALILVAILLCIVFVAEIAGCVTAYVERRSVYSSIERRMNSTITQLPINPDKNLEYMMWERLQNEWLNATAPKRVPKSCCMDQMSTDCLTLTNQPNSADGRAIRARCDNPGDLNTCPVYIRGCLPATEEYVRNNITFVASIGLGVIAFQVVGVVLLALLAKRIRNDTTI